MSLPLRVLIVSLVDISVTDSVVFFHLKQHPGSFTLPLLIGWIIITLLPILLTLMVWQQQQSKNGSK
jgi:hypothetical protein